MSVVRLSNNAVPRESLSGERRILVLQLASNEIKTHASALYQLS